MSDWFLHTGLYLLGVTLTTAASLLLVSRGLFGDRSKGRPRCPKCWYDMRGSLPKLECPECGHDAKRARRLCKNHRHWLPVVLGVVLALILSYPLIIVGGWCCEQPAIQKLAKRGHRVKSQRRLGLRACLVDWTPGRVVLFFDRVTLVRLKPSGTDEDMAECGKLSELKTVYADGRQMTDVAVRLTSRKNMLSRRQALAPSGAQVTDAGLAHLKGLSQLEHLYLSRTQVTDVGLAHLKGLSQLRFLTLYDTQVTDAGVAELKQALPLVRVAR